MLKRPGSDNGITWFFYKIRRKFRMLRTRGTLFHQLPRWERRQNRHASRLKKSGIRRRKLRHAFFYFRFRTLSRYNRRENARILRIKEGPRGYQLLTGKPVIHAEPEVLSTKIPFGKRIRRSLRIAGFILKKTFKSKPSPESLPVKKNKTVYRKLRYLVHTGNLFKINFRGVFESINRNYSFLGKGKYLIILLNSTFIFLLAYHFVFVLKEAAVVIAAGTFDIKSVMLYYDVEFLIRGRDWTVDSVKTVYFTGPFFSFIVTLIGLILFAFASHEKWTSRLFIMWVFLHAFTQSFGEMIFGALLNQGFGWVLAYLYVTDTGKMLLVVGILLGMISGGIFLSRFLLLTGNIYFNKIGKDNRTPFIMTQVFLPFLIGTGLIILLKQPLRNAFEIVVGSSMFLILLPAILRARFSNPLFFDEEPRKIKIKWIWILITLAAIILFRIYFWRGVRL